jgi:uroporphyrinogen-III synthase
MGKSPVRLQRRMAEGPGGLRGRRIVITRARDQAGDLVRALEARGAVPVVAPVIRIQPIENLGPLRAALAGLSAFRWVVFTSQNAVQIVFDRLVAWGLTPRVFAATSVAAIGTATADTLTQRGVTPALVPDEFVGEALAQALVARTGGNLAGARVLVPSAEDAREALAAGLRAHGAQVEVVPVYRTVAAPGGEVFTKLAGDIAAGDIDAVTFTSSSTVRHFVDLVGREAATSNRFVAATIGPITAGTAREVGLRQVIEATPHTVPGLMDALARRFA